MHNLFAAPAFDGVGIAPNAAVFRPLSEYDDAAAVLPGVLALVHEAGNPYFDWFFGGPERASGTLAAWNRRPSSELSTGRVTIALVGNELVGMYVGLAGLEVRRCRQADAVALLKEVGRDPAARAALLERIEASKRLFGRVRRDEFFLSKMGVVREHRGRGLGRAITREFLAAGRAAGFRRFRLDVSADNEPAIRIYRSFGFVAESEREAAGMRYLSMTLADAPSRSPRGARRLDDEGPPRR